MTDTGRDAILVLGPHRSGTSAFTGVLHRLGVDLGDDLLPANFDNRTGYWEHRGVLALHERILEEVGVGWHEYRPMPAGWEAMEGVVEAREELLELLRREFGDVSLWGVKDPRMCRLLPLWRDVLAELETAPRYVLVVRNPLEVARSLERRNGFPFTKGLLLWASEMLAAVEHTDGERRVVVSYDRLLDDWRTVVDEVSRALAIEWPEDPSRAGTDIDGFLRPSERHHRATMDDLAVEPSVPDWYVELYGALEAASRGDDTALQAAAVRASEALASATALFAPELDHLEAEVARLRVRVEELERAPDAEERARLERRAQKAEADLAAVEEHLTNLLSSRLLRFTRPFRRAWSRLGSLRR